MDTAKNIRPEEKIMTSPPPSENLDPETVRGFGQEWSYFRQQDASNCEKFAIFETYFSLFPWEQLPKNAVGADVGCGSGRWSYFCAPRVGKLYACDPSAEALAVARLNCQSRENVEFIEAGVSELPLPDQSLDFAFSLGVLHHVPDTEKAIRDLSKKLKEGAPFLLYLYFAFDSAPIWYRALWRCSDYFRLAICQLPFPLKRVLTDCIALMVYWPMARSARLLRLMGRTTSFWPLQFYADKSFYVMRTDSLDRFGTRLEKRFTKMQIQAILEKCGFTSVEFANHQPYWISIARKKS